MNFKNSVNFDFTGDDKLIKEIEYREISDDYHPWKEGACQYLRHTISQNYSGGIKYYYAGELGMTGEIRAFESCWKYCQKVLTWGRIATKKQHKNNE